MVLCVPAQMWLTVLECFFFISISMSRLLLLTLLHLGFLLFLARLWVFGSAPQPQSPIRSQQPRRFESCSWSVSAGGCGLMWAARHWLLVYWLLLWCYVAICTSMHTFLSLCSDTCAQTLVLRRCVPVLSVLYKALLQICADSDVLEIKWCLRFPVHLAGNRILGAKWTNAH